VINVFITNLAKYNEGELVGQWVTIPLPPEELDEVIAEILGDDEEYFISDYETDLPIDINEYTNVYELNKLADKLNTLDEHELKKIKALLEWGAYDLEDAIDNKDKYVLYEDIKTEKDLAYRYLDEVIGEEGKFLVFYVDVELLGHDLAMDGYISEYGYVEEC